MSGHTGAPVHFDYQRCPQANTHKYIATCCLGCTPVEADSSLIFNLIVVDSDALLALLSLYMKVFPPL